MSLPSPAPDQVFVTVSAIDSGFITLPEHLFVQPADADKKKIVPSLSFLVTHPVLSSASGSAAHKPHRILFDLGLRGCAEDYIPAQRDHLQTRRPYRLGPKISQRLDAVNIPVTDIDTVLLSHVHWDHTGDPSDFSKAVFWVGAGALHVLAHGLPGKASHQHFDPDLLPTDRTKELPPVASKHGWSPIGPFAHSLDWFGDGSIFVIDAPGHLPGHVALLCRTGPKTWVCMCGDAYHDIRLRTGEKEIGFWQQESDGVLAPMCIHLNPTEAAETIRQLGILASMEGVTVIAAHDVAWLEANQDKLLPGTIA